MTSARNAFAESVQDGQRVRMESAVAAPHDGRVADVFGAESGLVGTTIGEVCCHGSVGAVHASVKGMAKKKTREELQTADVGMTAGRKSVPEPWNRRLRGATTILVCLMHEVCYSTVPTSGPVYGATRIM